MHPWHLVPIDLLKTLLKTSTKMHRYAVSSLMDTAYRMSEQERRRQRRNKDLRTELEYFSEEYDEEREMEPRRTRVREAIPMSSLGQRAKDNGSQGMNLPSLLAAHLGRSENGQPLQLSLASMHEVYNRLMDRHPFMLTLTLNLTQGKAAVIPMESSFEGFRGAVLLQRTSHYYSYGGICFAKPLRKENPRIYGLVPPLGRVWGTLLDVVIWFGYIPTTIPDTTPSVILPSTHIDTTPIPIVSPTIPPSPDYTPASPDYSPASDTEFDPSKDPSSDHIPPLLATSPFLSSIDDSLDSGIPDTPSSPTHGTPFTNTTLSTQRSHVASGALRKVEGRATHETVEEEGWTLPLSLCLPSVHRSSAAISDIPSHDSSSASPSHKGSRSPAASVLLSSPNLGALSYARANLLPLPKRIMSPETTIDLEGCSEDSFEPYIPREAGLGVDFEDESSEPFRSRGTDLEIDVDVVRSDGIDIDPEIQAEIDECIAYADALRDRGIDARVVVKAIDREEIKTGVRGPVKVRVDRVTHPLVANDILEPAQEGAVEVIEIVQRDQGHRIIATGQQSADMLERIQELEWDNRRLRDMMDVASQRVAQSQRRELRVQREMR
ncbi:hypothetical protein Tco_0237234 [Tanacetum coccineum]